MSVSVSGMQVEAVGKEATLPSHGSMSTPTARGPPLPTGVIDSPATKGVGGARPGAVVKPRIEVGVGDDAALDPPAVTPADTGAAASGKRAGLAVADGGPHRRPPLCNCI